MSDMRLSGSIDDLKSLKNSQEIFNTRHSDEVKIYNMLLALDDDDDTKQEEEEMLR